MKDRYSKIIYKYLVKTIERERYLLQLQNKREDTFYLKSRDGLILSKLSNKYKIELLKEVGSQIRESNKIIYDSGEYKEWRYCLRLIDGLKFEEKITKRTSVG